jgi:hypothetical protein
MADPNPKPAPPVGVAERRAARLATPRLARELETIAAMLRIACHDRHGALPRDGRGLCEACADLLGYARARLANCPYGPEKPTCARCPIHCYGKRQREAVRDVMRYAGPRMLSRHPWLAIAHLVDGRRRVPPPPNARAAASAPAAVTAATAATAATTHTAVPGPAARSDSDGSGASAA